jgi:CheY-like chemotaxis protein
MSHSILIVEDEEKLAALLSDYLHKSSFVTHWLADGRSVAAWVKENHPDLILLDLMLPGRDGMEIIKEIRTFSTVPVIMVTARVEEIDRLQPPGSGGPSQGGAAPRQAWRPGACRTGDGRGDLPGHASRPGFGTHRRGI